MFGLLTRSWSWLVDGTTEATAWVLDRLHPRAMVHVELDGPGAVIKTRGSTIARLIGDVGSFRLEPPAAASQLAGAAIEVMCPPDWLFRRTLDPVSTQGAPFLDAFVKHQIDQLTPWRAEDVDVCVLHAPLPGDGSRLSVEIGVLPRRLTGAALSVLRTYHPARLVLSTRVPQDDRRFVMPIDDRSADRMARLRPAVMVALVLYLLAWPAVLGALLWTTAGVEDEIAAADQANEARQAQLAASARHDHSPGDGGAALGLLRQQRPRAVDLIEALSAAMPDSAYVTEVTINGAEIRTSGVSTDTSKLVPALETSGQFTNATFFDTTTRVEGDGKGDRFHIAMQARVPVSGPSPP